MGKLMIDLFPVEDEGKREAEQRNGSTVQGKVEQEQTHDLYYGMQHFLLYLKLKIRRRKEEKTWLRFHLCESRYVMSLFPSNFSRAEEKAL